MRLIVVSTRVCQLFMHWREPGLACPCGVATPTESGRFFADNLDVANVQFRAGGSSTSSSLLFCFKGASERPYYTQKDSSHNTQYNSHSQRSYRGRGKLSLELALHLLDRLDELLAGRLLGDLRDALGAGLVER